MHSPVEYRALVARAVSVLLLLLAPSNARARAPACERVERFTLANGVEVVLLPDGALPTVALVSSIHAGSRHDPPGYEGLAHFVEHLTFRDAPGFPSPHDLYAEAGATQVNAATWPDSTAFYALVPAAQLERGIWVEARRLAIGLDVLTQQAARAERRVLLREHELRYGFVPGYRLLGEIMAALYPPQHPYHSLLASERTLNQLTLEDARWFFARYYRPNRLRLVVAGDFHSAAALPLIERHFGTLRQGAEVQMADECTRWGAELPAPSSSRIVLRSRSREERLELYWPVTPERDPEKRIGVFRLLLGSLRDAARQAGLAREVHGQLVRRELASFWQLSVDVLPGQSLDHVLPLLEDSASTLRSSFSETVERDTQSQSLELWRAVDGVRLLVRALNLAQPECRPSECVDGAPQISLSAAAQLDGFDPRKALIIERRFSSKAAENGEIERSP
jgi:zinc protease